MNPVDYQAIRDSIIFAVMSATGLDQNHVIMLQPEVANWPRPSLPYIAIDFLVPGKRYGDDVQEELSEDANDGSALYNSGGPRGMLVSFDAYTSDHEASYSLMALLQAALDTEPTQIILAQSGVAVWKQHGVLDMSTLLEAGWEGRAHMDVEFGIASNLQIRIPYVEAVSLNGDLVTAQQVTPVTPSGDASTITVNCQETDAVGNFVAMIGDSEVESADCMTANLVPAIGIIISKPTPTSAVVQLNGSVPSGVINGLYPAREYFLSTNGSVVTAPLTACVYVQALGIAVTDKVMALNIAPTPVQRIP